MSSSTLFLIILLIGGFAVFIYYLFQKQEDIEEYMQNEIEIKKEENLAKFHELKQNFGQTTRIINYKFCRYILISDSRNLLMIDNDIYKFKDVITFDIKDNSTTIFASSSTTSTDTGSMIGRAIVGGILTGGVGAIIGGNTASTTTITEGNSTVSHNYSITITLNNIATPIKNIYIGDNGKIVNEIVAVLNIILSRNKSELEQNITESDINSFKKFYEYLPEYIDENTEKAVLDALNTSKMTSFSSDIDYDIPASILQEKGMHLKDIINYLNWNK